MNVWLRRSLRLAKVLKRFAWYLLPPAVYAPHKALLPRVLQKKTRNQLARAIERRFGASAGLDVNARDLHARADQIADFSAKMFWLHEYTPTEVAGKLARYREALGHRIDRVRLYREIARLEYSIGNHTTAAVYAIRAMRLLGEDRYGDLPWVVDALNQSGYALEAVAADAMFASHADRRMRCRQLLDSAYDRGRTLPPSCEFAVLEDRRGEIRPRVSVIVSLYNAAGKLRRFVDLLRRQTLARARQLEIIFVDSASPADECGALHAAVSNNDLPYLFARTQERESIQTAWNRGIGLARAPYLAFLGVDETVLPTAYEELAAELDRHAEIDWVMADSLVTDVDADGNPVRDVMPYDRAGYTQDHVYLETCYLSWVGGLYRRSIHDRFGYYDGTFRAAGDTEFKGRILPHIRSKHLPRTLGLFLNYPEERTTASPRAELEDLRAWYLHRTSAGIDYAFSGRSNRDLEEMVYRSLAYRKSYCRHVSSDIDYACAALEVLHDRAPAGPIHALREPANRLLAAYRSLDCLALTSAAEIERAIVGVHQATLELNRSQHGLAPDCPVRTTVFADNRYEQHVQLW